MLPSYFQKSGICWQRIEMVTLMVGFVGTAIACLSSYSWHWFRESMFFMMWSALPYGLFLVGSQIARRVVSSRLLQPVTTVLAIAITALSLMAYMKAVLKPNHSSGMVFFILPLSWMIAIPVVLTGIVVGFLIAVHCRKP